MTDKHLQVNLSSATIQRGKHDKEHPYVMISKEMFRDFELSIKAKGVLCYLLSLPDTWQLHPRQLSKVLGMGKNTVYDILSELLEKGYAKKKEIRAEGGLFSSVLYEFYEEKLPEDFRFKEKITVSGKRDPEKRDTDFRTLENIYHTEERTLEKKDNTTPSHISAVAEAADAAVDVSSFPPKLGKMKAAPFFSEKVQEVSAKMIDMLVKYNPVYRPPNNLDKFNTAVKEMVEKDNQDIIILLQTFEWAVSDNEQRGDFKGWQGVIATNNKAGKPTTPAQTFKKYYDKIYSQMNAQPKRKFAPSSNDAVSLKNMEEWAKGAL